MPWKKNNKEKYDVFIHNEERYCKRCGTELPSTRKQNLCENCQRDSIDKKRKAVLGGGGVAVALLGIGAKALPYLKNGAAVLKNIIRP